MSFLKCARPRIARGNIDARKVDLSLVKVPFPSALRFHAEIDTLKVNNSVKPTARCTKKRMILQLRLKTAKLGV